MKTLITIWMLARLISGEAGTCDTEAKLAVAHVKANREAASMVGGWYGDARPTAEDFAIALHWASFADPTDGALFLVNDKDLKLEAVREMLAERQLVRVWRCGERTLTAWK